MILFNYSKPQDNSAKTETAEMLYVHVPPNLFKLTHGCRDPLISV